MVLVTGASGFVGSALVDSMTAAGRRACRLLRSPSGAPDGFWDPARGVVTFPVGAPIDSVVHLAGEPIADGRWTRAKRRRIIDSRVAATELLCRAISGLSPRPACLLSASATGYYGNRGDTVLTESSGPGSGFLPEVCEAWERATRPAEDAGIRVVHLRIGIVLGLGGGMLARVLTPFRLGLGGRLGSGWQHMSWISIDDTLGAIEHLLDRADARGPFNLVAPNPVTNAEFTVALARALGRSRFLPVPGFALRLAFGAIADEALLASARVAPERLVAARYAFRHPKLEGALASLLATR